MEEVRTVEKIEGEERSGKIPLESSWEEPSGKIPSGKIPLKSSWEELSGGSGPSGTGKREHVRIDLIKEIGGDTEFELERLLEDANSHKFYCPNCKACIQKVYVRRGGQEVDVPLGGQEVDVPLGGQEPITCTFCFSILVLIGEKLVSICNPDGEKRGTRSDPLLVPSPIPQPTPLPEGPAKKWEILKSIVYGGLIESITSLNIVTSAAGADATALKILALGLANLIGGLFVIGHNLMEMRNDRSGGSTDRTNEETDRYHRELGRRENFKLHAAVVVLSFLLFGLVAPVTYSFSFLKSGNKDLKLVAVAAASLFCITVLAIGKAYIQKASNFFGYMKTVLTFVISGFMASGVSYVVGHLINKLLEKLGLFESSSDFTLPLPVTAPPKFGWGFH